jgi:predicted 3-demethylubiquinone-9 3-methyltransferase (glyoxalase superfamily)
VEWTSEGLRANGFDGFGPLSDFDLETVPDVPGVYLILRDEVDEPAFLATSRAAHFKGRDPSLPLARVRDRWVPGAAVLYVGRTKHLSRRIDELRRFGGGEPIAHWGGRLVWQLADSADLRIAWRPAGEQDLDAARTSLLGSFRDTYQSLPYANLRQENSDTSPGRDGRIAPLAIEPQLMFTGDADAAMTLYTSVFGDSVIESVTRDPAPDGPVVFATFRLGQTRFRCIDSKPVHDFTFTPSIAFAVDCRTAEEVDAVVALLGEDGQVLMPVATYPFSERYGWIVDRFGVSWQVGVASGA